jgi:MFS family permease
MAHISDHKNPKTALLILYMTMFLVMAGFGIITPFFPFLAKEMGANAFELGLMIALFALAQVIAAPLWGRLSDQVGHKLVLVTGLIGYALSFYMLFLAPNLAMMMLSRVVGGLLSASTFPSAQAYLVELTTNEKRAYGMSYLAAASNLGFLLGPTIGSIFSVFGLRATFAIGGSLIFVTGIFGAVLLPGTRKSTDSALKTKRPDLHAIWWAISGRDSILLWVTLLISFGSITIYSIMGYFMIERFDASTSEAVIVYTLMGGISVLLQVFFVGRALKRFGEDLVVIGSLILGAVGFTGLVYAPSLLVLYVCVMVIGGSLALCRPAILVALSRRTQLGQGLTMGLQSSFDSIGRVIGPMWAGWVFGVSLSMPYWTSAVAFALAAVLHITAMRSSIRIPASEADLT